MTLKGTAKVDTNRLELDIAIDGEAFENAVALAYKRNGKKINVPGFRKGKAPRKIIESFYGENFFYEDAFNLLYPDTLDAAIKEAGARYVDDKVDVNLVSIGKEGVEFKATVTVMPEVELSEYKRLKAEAPKAEVTDDDIENEINRMRENNARLINADDRAAAKGDVVDIDFEGLCDGEAFEGGKAEGYSLTLGSGSFIPGFEEQIEGHSAGEEFEINVTFPDDYSAEKLAGKSAVFKIKLNGVKVRELPEADDEFAKDVSEFDTMAELREDLKNKAVKRGNDAFDAAIEDKLLKELIGNMTAEVPQALIDNRARQDVENFAYRITSQGLSFKKYLEVTGETVDDMVKRMTPQAEETVKARLALEKVAELEHLEPTDEEIDAEFEQMAKNSDTDVEKVKASVPRDGVKADLAVRKALEFVKENAVIGVTEPEKADDGTGEKPAAEDNADNGAGDAAGE